MGNFDVLGSSALTTNLSSFSKISMDGIQPLSSTDNHHIGHTEKSSKRRSQSLISRKYDHRGEILHLGPYLSRAILAPVRLFSIKEAPLPDNTHS